MKYQVMGMKTGARGGVGPATVEADSPEEAKNVFAEQEGTTVSALKKAGMVVMAELVD